MSQSIYSCLICGIMILAPLVSLPQRIENVEAIVDGGKVVVTYDLTHPKNDQFKVQLYASSNNYTSPLRQVTGDVGADVTPGIQKKITWDASGELNQYDGQVTFEVRADIITADIVFNNPISGAKFKRGKTYNVVWRGGRNKTQFSIELYRNDERHKRMGTTTGARSFVWSVPSDLKAGGNYDIRLKNGADNAGTSARFKISRKIPLMIKLIPVAGIAVIARAIFSNKKDDPFSPTKNPLPEPPNEPSGG